MINSWAGVLVETVLLQLISCGIFHQGTFRVILSGALRISISSASPGGVQALARALVSEEGGEGRGGLGRAGGGEGQTIFLLIQQKRDLQPGN